jgi:hypothetical protein
VGGGGEGQHLRFAETFEKTTPPPRTHPSPAHPKRAPPHCAAMTALGVTSLFGAYVILTLISGAAQVRGERGPSAVVPPPHPPPSAPQLWARLCPTPPPPSPVVPLRLLCTVHCPSHPHTAAGRWRGLRVSRACRAVGSCRPVLRRIRANLQPSTDGRRAPPSPAADLARPDPCRAHECNVYYARVGAGRVGTCPGGCVAFLRAPRRSPPPLPPPAAPPPRSGQDLLYTEYEFNETDAMSLVQSFVLFLLGAVMFLYKSSCTKQAPGGTTAHATAVPLYMQLALGASIAGAHRSPYIVTARL